MQEKPFLTKCGLTCRWFEQPHVTSLGLSDLTHWGRDNMATFTDDIFKFVFFNANIWISTEISRKFVFNGPIYNMLALVGGHVLNSRKTYGCYIIYVTSETKPMTVSATSESNFRYAIVTKTHIVAIRWNSKVVMLRKLSADRDCHSDSFRWIQWRKSRPCDDLLGSALTSSIAYVYTHLHIMASWHGKPLLITGPL